MPELELFRAGEYPQGIYTVDDVKEIAESYDPKLHEAPVVIGHKKNDERAKTGEDAYGWVKSLRADDNGVLYGDVDIHESLKEKMKLGSLKKWSIELYNALKDAGGKKYLKALAILGAAVPQVKGLAPAKFNDEIDSTVITQEDQQMADPITAADLEKSEGRIMGFVKGLFSGFTDKTPPDPTKKVDDDDNIDIEDALDEMSGEDIGTLLNTLADNERVQEVAANLEQQESEAQMSELDGNADHQFRIKHQKEQVAGWIDKMIKSGKLSAASKDAGIAAFCELLAFSEMDDNDDGMMKFSEKGKEITPLKFFQDMIENHFTANTEEIVKPGDSTKKGKVVHLPKTVFAAVDEHGHKLVTDDANVALAEAAQSYALEHKVPLEDAMITVARSAAGR